MLESKHSYSMFAGSMNCRLIVSADAELNGKLAVEVKDVSGSKMDAFLQPNSFKSSGSLSFLENQKIVQDLQVG